MSAPPLSRQNRPFVSQMQVGPLIEQSVQACPLLPHAPVSMPGWQLEPWQHPLEHDELSQ